MFSVKYRRKVSGPMQHPLDSHRGIDHDRIRMRLIDQVTDFMRVGIPFNLMFWGLTVLIAPRIFPF